MNTIFFNNLTMRDVKKVGGKAASLGEMFQAGIPVPPGFAITADAYKDFVGKPFSQDFIAELLNAFDKLGANRVAVRSSALAEDSSDASWAGQLETYLNVTRDKLLESIKLCWDSINSENVLAYAKNHHVKNDDLVVGVAVQKMVESETAGVMFSVNPVTKNRDEVMIEAGLGLGEMVVQGLITPDNFVVSKKLLKITEFNINIQEKMMVFAHGENRIVSVPEKKQDKIKLAEEYLVELAKIGIRIEKHYKKPQDMEWAFEKGNIYIVQSRPITTL